jgi:Secretion system C-terminal sorting domain
LGKDHQTMKKIYTLVVFAALNNALMAQCTGCTTTISTATSSPVTVTSGNTLCITSTGSVSGTIVVDGGNLCNEGSITSSVVVVKNSGAFNNFSTVNVNTFRVISSYVYNWGSMVSTLYKANEGSTGCYGDLTTFDLVDSASSFVAQANVIVNNDFINRDNSNFSLSSSSASLTIGRDFSNTNFATFYVGECMIPVGRNFTNNATISGGPVVSGCGGFKVTGITTNSSNGFIGMDGGNLDICDLGSPPGNVDVNTGTINSTVTFCSCTADCLVSVEEEMESAQVFTVFPVPAQSDLTIELKKSLLLSQIKLLDATGRLLQINFTKKENGLYTADISQVCSGAYQLVLISEMGIYSKTVVIE